MTSPESSKYLEAEMRPLQEGEQTPTADRIEEWLELENSDNELESSTVETLGNHFLYRVQNVLVSNESHKTPLGGLTTCTFTTKTYYVKIVHVDAITQYGKNYAKMSLFIEDRNGRNKEQIRKEKLRNQGVNTWRHEMSLEYIANKEDPALASVHFIRYKSPEEFDKTEIGMPIPLLNTVRSLRRVDAHLKEWSKKYLPQKLQNHVYEHTSYTSRYLIPRLK